jgi:hypothetical protein
VSGMLLGQSANQATIQRNLRRFSNGAVECGNQLVPLDVSSAATGPRNLTFRSSTRLPDSQRYGHHTMGAANDLDGTCRNEDSEMGH